MTNRKALSVVTGLALLVQAAFPATYYVRKDGNNANAGTSDTAGGAWLTIQFAANTAVAGDTVIVRSGFYNEAVSTKANGTESGGVTNWIRFTGGGVASLNNFTAEHQWNAIEFFTFTNTAAVVYSAVAFFTNNVRLATNYIADVPYNAVRMVDDSGSVPPVAAWPTNVWILGNTATNVDTVSQAFRLILNDSLIEGNRIDGVNCDAIDLWGSRNRVLLNVVTNIEQDVIGDENHNDFIQTWNAGAGYHSTNNLIGGNLVINCYAQICNLEDGNSTNEFGNWTFTSNVFVNVLLNGNPGIINNKWINNTFWHAPYSTGSYTPIIFFDQTGFHSRGGVITNNIFANCGYSNGADGLKIGYYSPSYKTNSGANYNMVSGLAIHNYPSVSGFTDPNGVNGGDPLFVDIENGNAALQAGSPALGTGLGGVNIGAWQGTGSGGGGGGSPSINGRIQSGFNINQSRGRR